MANIEKLNIFYSIFHCQENTIANFMYLINIIASVGEYGYILSNPI